MTSHLTIGWGNGFKLFHLRAHTNYLLKLCGTPQNTLFAELTKKTRYHIDSFHTTTIVLAVVIFLFDKLREKRSVLLTKESAIACF